MLHFKKIGVFLTCLWLSLLVASANTCEDRCDPKGKCFTEMNARGLACDPDTQQRPVCDHHWVDDNLDEVSLKSACCETTCYALFNNNQFECPVGTEPPTESERDYQSSTSGSEEWQRVCCHQPRVSCYTMYQANNFTCASTHFHPTNSYLNDDIHEDMSSKTEEELQSQCCREKSVCYSKLSEKNLDCDGFGTMPGEEDTLRDDQLTGDADTDNSILQTQCCKPNCFSAMQAQNLTCTGNTIMRAKDDGHMPGDTSKEGLQNECCQTNCYSRMMANESLTCPEGQVVKSKDDMYDPGDTSDDLITTCCYEPHCGERNYCFAAMNDKGVYDCPEYTEAPSMCDEHWPFDDDPEWDQRMDFIMAKSGEQVQAACCRNTCYGALQSKGLRCPVGYKGRGQSDHHNPFGNADWSALTDEEITGECCREVNQCHVKLNENHLGCAGYGTEIDEFDTWNADVDTSNLNTADEIQTACCKKSCAMAMSEKSLECEYSEEVSCDEYHRPYEWTSFDQPDADVRWACCEAGDARPSFEGCQSLLGCSGDDCHNQCPGGERMRDGEWDNPFGQWQDFTKIEETERLDKCCKATCYDQLDQRGLNCPSDKMSFGEGETHNPFRNDEHQELDMRAQTNEGILDGCCRPLNKCYVRLTEMGLNCDGAGAFPGDTEGIEYDFEPQDLTNADDVQSMCCKPNCFSALNKRSLQCETGVSRSEHDGYNPFGDDGFDQQTNSTLLEECCSQNCYSYFRTHELTCVNGTERGMDDFHHVDFENLDTPEDAKVQCCRVSCSDEMNSRSLGGCDQGYKVKDDQRSAEDWGHHSDERLVDECCEELSEECKTAVEEGNARKQNEWDDKRPQTPAERVKYFNDWGDKIVEIKTKGLRYHVVGCKLENENFNTQAECEAADKWCCFACDDLDNCASDMPLASTCLNDQPSAFMEMFGNTDCSTSGNMEFTTMSECGECPSARDLFEQYDEGTLFGTNFWGESGIGATKSGFYGGTNVHNVANEISIDDEACPEPAAGLLVSPHNSGAIALTGKQGTLYAVVDVANEVPADPSMGVHLGGDADYLLVGGSNEGNVDVTTTGQLTVVGMENKGEVSATGVDDILIGNTINSGKVLLNGGNTGALVNVVNQAGAEVVVEGGGTWTLTDVSNAAGATVSIDGGDFVLDGIGTRNDGIIEVKSGQIAAKVKENTGTITIAEGVTGSILLCANSGSISPENDQRVVIDPTDPFCELEEPTATPAPPEPSLPEFFFCRNADTHAETNWTTDSGESMTCLEAAEQRETNWEAVRYEVDSPDMTDFYARCCDPEPSAPEGKRYIIQRRTVRRKIVRATSTVSIDFTDPDNNAQKVKFEAAYVERANAKSGNFEYTKISQSNNRRHLSEDTEVTATLEYDDDDSAEAGKDAVAASDFATGLSQDLQDEGVEITLTETTASIDEIVEEVVEEVLADIPDTTTASTETDQPNDDTETDQPNDDTETDQPNDDTETDQPNDDTTSTESPLLSLGLLSNPTVTFAIMLLTTFMF